MNNRTPKEEREFALKIAGILDEKKGKNIVLISLANKSIIADYFVIVSARSTTAVKALADAVDEKLSKEDGIEPLRRDGFSEAKWIAVDYGSVILHVFHEETREYYHLERLWIDGENFESFGTPE